MKAPARLRGDEFYESAGFGLRTARFTIGRGIASDFIDMLRDHRIGWVNMEGLNEVRARFIGVAEQSRLVRCLHKCRGAVLACNLVRRPVLLVAGNEQGSVLEVFLRCFQVFVFKSLRAGEVDLFCLALLSRRGRLLRWNLRCIGPLCVCANNGTDCECGGQGKSVFTTEAHAMSRLSMLWSRASSEVAQTSGSCSMSCSKVKLPVATAIVGRPLARAAEISKGVSPTTQTVASGPA